MCFHFSDSHPAGETQIAYGYAAALAKRGHRVTVLSPRVTLERPVEGLEAVELRAEYAGGGAGGGGYADEKLRWWEFSVRARREAKERAGRGEVDVVHHLMPAHAGKFSLLSGTGLPFVYGPMLLTWEHGGGQEQVVEPGEYAELMRAKVADRMDMHLGARLFERTLSRADVIMVSLEKIARGFAPERALKTVQLPYGVDTGRFRPNGGPPEGPPTILFMGLVEERKGIYDLLQAVPLLDECRGTRLSIVGGGELERVREAAAALGITDRVAVHGPVPYTRIDSHFRRASVFCLPSHGEPFGMVLLQAMATGKPIVATRTGGVDEIVEDGRSGILVDQERPEALARALDRVLSNRDLREAMGAYNRRQAVDRYDWSVVTAGLERVYEQALGNREMQP